MAIPKSLDQLEIQKFIESLTVPNQPAVVVVNPDGSNLAGGVNNPATVAQPGAQLRTSVNSVTNVFPNVGVAERLTGVKVYNGEAFDYWAFLTLGINAPGVGDPPFDLIYVPSNSQAIIGSDFYGPSGLIATGGLNIALSTNPVSYAAVGAVVNSVIEVTIIEVP
ncbi:MAG: hypothetical protein ACYS1A_19255 [Planctomycetota bacterium]|jgi:hypothetical protein